MHASEKYTERVQKLRAEYWTTIGSVNLEDLVFIDEAGVNIAITRRFARSPQGSRAYASHPQGRGKNVTMIGAMSTQGIIAAMTFTGGTNASANLNNSAIATFSFGAGAGGNIRIETGNLNLREGTSITTSTINPSRIDLNSFTPINLLSNGQPELREVLIAFIQNLINTIEPGDSSNFEQAKPGNVNIFASDSVVLSGISPDGESNIISTATFGSASAGNITLETGELIVRDRSLITSSTTDKGQGGNITLTASDSIKLIGRSGLYTSTFGTGAAGNLKIFNTGNLTIQDGSQIAASTIGEGRGGNIDITADTVEIKGISAEGSSSGVQSRTLDQASSADAGDIKLTTRLLNINGGAVISTQSINQGQAGKITIRVDENLNALDGRISTSSRKSSGGDINIDARDIRLFGNSDISTFVSRGAGGGGDIKITANSIFALNDSDIFAFAQDGKGGNITLNTPAFFGQNYRPIVPGTNTLTLDKNNQVDINASGAVSGVIVLPDTTFVQNNLGQLPQNAIDTNALIANSCISRGTKRQENSFTITGSGALTTNRPGVLVSNYTTGEVRGVETTSRPWKKGDAIIEPQGLYRLNNGQLLLSRECSN
ncbi:transposase [Nostoc sp. ATCC 53789]|uniref:transposase n=1 Tax=Nostoc sp. ATCC 53789 TaxID=76335 RepID=UPI000DED1FF8|nr:transposase [Nostoc sp. ATCC 53789]QHG15330.1 hypothetical protein GJB62_04685 [Nostoc sp. ATCC 53789]RCJ32825.1 hypothetical protein A6V25_12060 [Nostoc sp. ATCC 53789]